MTQADKTAPYSQRKRHILELANRLGPERDRWIDRNRFYYEDDARYLRFLIPEGSRVLDLGCGTGRLLASLNPSQGVGVDFSDTMVAEARERHPGLDFRVSDIEAPGAFDHLDGPFDYIVLSDTVGSLEDVQGTLERLHGLCNSETRLVIAYFSSLWAPVLRVAQLLGQHMPQVEQNWLSGRDLADILELAAFDTVRVDARQIVPKRMAGMGAWMNRHVGTLPGLRAAALRTYVVARSLRAVPRARPSASVVIPCRNEAGNVEAAATRIPDFCDDIEILFVEGHSRDETLKTIECTIAEHPERDIKLIQQDGIGKGDAVRKGFELARGEILMILDADLTTPPEDLPKFYDAVVSGNGELIIGTRLVYPMEAGAMRILNVFGNKVFSVLFSWLLNQRITDTLCGTKVLSRHNYDQIRRGRPYFGDFDPFGDFDLIFGAAKLNLKIVQVPVRYRAREYGQTQISRFRHGWLLVRMVLVAYRRLKAI